jgi:thiamine-phosphate pyrophosphorylase
MEKPAYRIIDANFNRAREALRVMEEYCRFILDSTTFTTRAKQMRHELSAQIGKFDQGRLLAARDTGGDVGTATVIENKLVRKDLSDGLTAAAKRLTEALRALSETIEAKKPELAANIEQLRYTAYTLEKDIILFALPQEKFRPVRLYVIITSTEADRVRSLVEQCAAGGADCIQLRAKDIETKPFLDLASDFVGACRNAGVLSIINDRVDIAIACDADGVHLGQTDLPVDLARTLQHKPLIIGKSTHSIAELEDAIEEMPTYVGLGTMFPTKTKEVSQPVGPEYAKEAIGMLQHTGIAHVAIGGISGQNIGVLLDAGAKAVALCSAVTSARDPAKVCRGLKRALQPDSL